ncbi:MAG: hypothetical protein WBG86_21725, partial [Polyangiales bacterium]
MKAPTSFEATSVRALETREFAFAFAFQVDVAEGVKDLAIARIDAVLRAILAIDALTGEAYL